MERLARRKAGNGMTRRAWIGGWAGAVASAQAPSVIRADRPDPPEAVMAGDVIPGAAVIWSRSAQPARMVVNWNISERGPVQTVTGPHCIAATDYTGRLELSGLPAGQTILYEVRFQSLRNDRALSAPLRGMFHTPPSGAQDLRFLWTGDQVGQGWGINPELGGFRVYEAMARRLPDFFLHSGDVTYADNPLVPEVRLPDGSKWRNIVTESKSKVAESLDEFRGQYRYNLLDEHLRRFCSTVGQIWQWDDHETMNNWSPGKSVEDDPRYKEKNVPLMVARSTRAFLEYAPLRPSAHEIERVYRHIPYGPLLDVFVLDMRSYRGPNTWNRQEQPGPDTQYLGRPQLDWLKRGLAGSKALWKAVAADMPIGLGVPDGTDAQGRPRWENNANGDGPALGRELEFAELLRGLKREGVRNVVWFTADVHYTAAHYYDPRKAQFTDFLPFWEFVSGPMHAGTFGPNATDNTFGIQVVYQKAPPAGQMNLSPAAGMQFFGEVEIARRTGEMTVTLRDVRGASLFRQVLHPERA
jgi:alkaline phosphatase D